MGIATEISYRPASDAGDAEVFATLVERVTGASVVSIVAGRDEWYVFFRVTGPEVIEAIDELDRENEIKQAKDS